MTSHDSLRLVSYNCRGWNSGQHTVFDLLQSCDICFIQEHWLLHEQLNLLNIHCDFLSTGVSGMDSSEFHLGRPFGGCAILYRRSFLSHVSRLDTSSKRFCSVLLRDRRGVSTLCICVYLPHNDGSVASHNDFLITLGELEGFIDRHNFDHLLIAGDLNVDFSRPSVPLQHLRNFMADLNLVSADLPFHPAIHFTYMRDDGCAHSWPDHFLCDTSLSPDLSVFHVVDSGSNLSDHLPLACSLHVDLSLTPPPSVSSPPSSFHIVWHAANPDAVAAYCDMVSHHLPSLPDSVWDCCDPLCTEHYSVLDRFCEQLTHCLQHCAFSTLPTSRRIVSVPGWNTAARSFKEKANFWHSVWKQAGSPSSGVLHCIKRNAKSRYKYEVRRLKRREQFIASEDGCSPCFF